MVLPSCIEGSNVELETAPTTIPAVPSASHSTIGRVCRGSSKSGSSGASVFTTFSGSSLLSTKEELVETTSDSGPLGPQPIDILPNFQDDHNTRCDEDSPRGVIYDLNRFKRCVLACANPQELQEVLRLQDWAQEIPVQGSSLRPQHRAKGLHQADEAYLAGASLKRRQCPGLPGRLANLGKDDVSV